jgi:CRP-like cAMP-binding protein
MAIGASNVRNRLLTALPPKVLEQLLPDLRWVDMPFHSTLLLPGAAIDKVLFLESGWVSLLVPMENGGTAEVGLVGREGMVGLPLLFDIDQAMMEVFVQSAGRALAMEAGAFRRAVDENASLRELLLRYAFAFNTQLTMTAACNGRHVLEERLARWLLMSHDRADGDEFSMTHEFLSLMLGVRRASVTVAAGHLQKAGLIRYELGSIRVMNRSGLEAAACECHGRVQSEFTRVLGAPPRRVPT